MNFTNNPNYQLLITIVQLQVQPKMIDAMLQLIDIIGFGPFAQSTLLQSVNNNCWLDAANQFLNYPNGEVLRKLFLEGVYSNQIMFGI